MREARPDDGGGHDPRRRTRRLPQGLQRFPLSDGTKRNFNVDMYQDRISESKDGQLLVTRG